MKKIFKALLVVTLFAFAISMYNIKAEGLELAEIENVQTDAVANIEESTTSESNRKEEEAAVLENEQADEEDEEESDGLDPEIEALAHNNSSDKHQNCYFFINTYNNQSIGKACTPEGASGNKTFRGANYLKPFSSQGISYEFDGWYDENDNLLETSTTIKVRVSAPNGKCEVHYIYAKWKQYKDPVLYFNYYDNVSTGSGSWSNLNGDASSLNHTFREPAGKNHYSFLYWKIDDTIYNDGDVYTYDISALSYNDEVTIDAYAWWKADVTLNLYDGTTSLGSDSKFDSINITDVIESNPTKEGYKFLGWVDEEGNDVTETTFYAEEPSINPAPKTVKLYAKWQKLVSITVTKEWDDTNNTESTTKPTVTVNLVNGSETVESVDLNDENQWTYTFVVPEFDEENNTINYEITENPVEGYATSITGDMTSGFIVKNTYIVTKMDITITKEWDDEDDEDEVRPTSVTVYLYANGEKIQDVEITEEDGWSVTLSKMPIYDDEGGTIEYSVVEGEVEYYDSSVTGNSTDGFVVKNYHEVGGKGEGEDPDEPVNNEVSDNPKTGDNIFMSIGVLFISLLGLIITVYFKKYSFNK